MAIGPTTGVNTGSAVGSAVQQVSSNQQMNQQTFLTLLTTQLANQDPSQPMDTNQMTAQLAQFATVEGVNSTTTSVQQSEGISLIGKTVNALATVNNVPQAMTGKVVSASWNGSNTSLTLDNKQTITLSQITSVGL